MPTSARHQAYQPPPAPADRPWRNQELTAPPPAKPGPGPKPRRESNEYATRQFKLTHYRGYQPSRFVDRWHRPRIESDNAAGTGIEGALTGSWRPPATGDASTQPGSVTSSPPTGPQGRPNGRYWASALGSCTSASSPTSVLWRRSCFVRWHQRIMGLVCFVQACFQGEMALTNTRSGRRGACPAHRSRTGSAGRPLIMVAHRCTPSHAALKLPRPRILLGPSASERSASGALSSCGQSNTRPSASPDGSLDHEC